MSPGRFRYRLGWMPDYPDFRDFSEQHEQVEPFLARLQRGPAEAGSLPAQVDLRPWCSPVEYQGELNSCTAHAGVGLVEYYEQRAFNRYLDASRLFLYKATRNLLHQTGDNGAYLRTTMAALVLFGVPPEEYWPYTDDPAKFDQEPPAFCYAFAQNYQALKYLRLDGQGTAPEEVLKRIKSYLAAGLPAIFGFSVYRSLDEVGADGKVPFPAPQERLEGGHAVMAAGYDDTLVIAHPKGGPRTQGAILIRNSWGRDWGEGGYGWLPYDYVLRGLAEDWWTLLKQEWVDTGKFGLPET